MKWPAVAVAMLLAAIAYAPRLVWIELYSDDGLVASHAMMLAAGLAPYRQFFAAEPPGAMVFYAALFKLFGTSYLVLRLGTATAVVLTVGLLADAGRRLKSAWWAAGAATLWGVQTSVLIQYSPYHALGASASVLAAWCLLQFSESGRTLWPALAGVAAAVAVIFIQAAFPVALAAVLAAAMVKQRIRDGVVTAVAGLATAVLSTLAMLLTGALAGFWADTVVYQLTVFSKVSNRPIPWLPQEIVATTHWEAGAAQLWPFFLDWPLAFAAPLAVVAWTAWRVAQRRWDDATIAGVMASGLTASALLTYHTGSLFWFDAPLSLLLVAAGLRSMASRASTAAKVPVYAVALLGLAPVLTGVQMDCRINVHGPLAVVATPTGTVCAVRKGEAPELASEMEMSAAHTTDPMAFLPTNSPAYLLTGRVPPVSYHFIEPGNQTPAQLRQLEFELVDRRVLWIVYHRVDWASLTDALPDNKALGAGDWQFEDWLAANYAVSEEQGPVVLYRLRG